jgi:hypothetical protein
MGKPDPTGRERAVADDLRWQQRSKVADALAEDLPVMQEAVRQSGRPGEEAIADALTHLSGGGDLVGWAAVAITKSADGSTHTYVCGDPASSPLEVKGYLHSGIWEAAHR